MGPVKTHTFNKVRYDIDICGPIDGSCDYRNGGKPSIRITTESFTKQELIAILHECGHAEDWSKSEDIIDRISTEVGTFLWRLGYRRAE